jgi:hypothetical protein
MRTVVIAALLLAALPVKAGYYLEHEAVLPNPADLTKTIKQTLHSWHDGKRFKRESPLRSEVVIIDLEKREVYGVNSAKKTYWKMPADKYQKLALMSLVVMGIQIDATGQPRVPDPLFAETKQTATIEGRKAFEVKITAPLPPGVQTSIWVSPDVPIDTKQLVSQMRVSLGDPKGEAYEALFRQWGSLRGYPVQNVTTIDAPQGRITTSETLLTAREQKIDPKEFEVPKGYALVVDPVTELEKKAQQMQQPAGIGAPLKSQSGTPVGPITPAPDQRK